MLKIIIADDHAIVRRGLKDMILDHYPFALIGEASDSEELLKKVFMGPWDVIICDLMMPGRSGLDALKQLRHSFPRIPVLVMSMCTEDQYAVRAMKLGAWGYFTKASIHDDLLQGIETVRAGKKFITPLIAAKLLEALEQKDGIEPHKLLSDREFDVFKLLVSGRTVTEIACILSLSSNTISTYRSRILDKMMMHSNAELIRYALEKNLL
jgi:two-component system invasion response regulator UvrY